MLTLDTIKTQFPKVKDNAAETGYIPIDFFTANEKEFRQVMKVNSLRVFYRGPRHPFASVTLRKDAVAAVLYSTAHYIK